MSGIATAAVAAGLGGALISSSAAKSAAGEQADAATLASQNSLAATQQSNAILQQQYAQNQANQSPYLQAGQNALAALSGGLGLARTVTPTGNISNASTTTAPAGSTGATTDTSGNVGTTSGLAGTTNYGATQSDLDNSYNSQQTNGVGNFTQTFTPSDLTTDPSYQWRLQQGESALAASAAAKGLTSSGQNLKDVSDYAQGAASTEYQAAYDRFMENQNTAVSRLQSLAGVGSDTASSLGASGASTANNIANNTTAGTAAANNYSTSAAAANAAGTVGTANAITGGINTGLNTWGALQGVNNQSSYNNRPTSGSVTLSDGTTFAANP